MSTSFSRRYRTYGSGSISDVPTTRSSVSPGVNLRPWRCRCSRSQSRSGANSPASKLVFEIGQIGGDLLPDLGGDQVAERVGREVADRAARPVDVLQHALGVVRHVDPQVVVHPAVPLLGQLLERELVVEHRLLELEAEDDVQVVGRLVRLDPDQRRLDEVGLAVPLLGVVAGELGCSSCRRGKKCRQNGSERPTRFSHIRLCDSCMPSETPRASGLRSSVWVDLALVEAVAELVHRPEEAAEMLGEVARRDADVGRSRCPRRTDARSGRGATRRRCSRRRARPRARTPSARRGRSRARGGALGR